MLALAAGGRRCSSRAPVLALWLARAGRRLVAEPAARAPRGPTLADAQIARSCATLARRTWRVLRDLRRRRGQLAAAGQLQEHPPRGVAHRTSPTNIGLSLLANLAAYDFGYITAGELIERTDAHARRRWTSCERYRGHFYNWYDTQTLEPLRPLYVSTVDSGNLAGHLLTLRAGPARAGRRADRCAARLRRARATRSTSLAELRGDAAARALRSRVAGCARDRRRRTLRRCALPRHCSSARDAIAARACEPPRAATRRDARAGRARWPQCRDALDDLRELAPWIALPSAELALPSARRCSPTLRDWRSSSTLLDASRARWRDRTPRAERGTQRWLAQLRRRRAARARRASASRDCERSRSGAASSPTWTSSFLYDRARHLLAIGYNVGEHRLDASFYDLLASEARLASFVAIAQGKLPQEHWFALGRLLTTVGGEPALLSWSGSMFEYLMPLLVMPTYENTLLDQTYRAVVERQIDYGTQRGVPWGISESGYNTIDAHLNYQYRAFGVPGLGLQARPRRRPGRRAVRDARWR